MEDKEIIENQHKALLTLQAKIHKVEDTLEYQGKHELKTMHEMFDISQESLRRHRAALKYFVDAYGWEGDMNETPKN